MGFRDFMDAVLGRSRLPKARSEKLFAISTASVTLETGQGLKPAGKAGICFKPIEASAYAAARKEIEELLEYSAKETGTEYLLEKDEYNFLWAIFKDPDFEDLVANIHLVSQTLEEHGFGKQLLCAIYRFEAESEGRAAGGAEDGAEGNVESPETWRQAGKKAVYWIYNFKQGSYYPFVPLAGNKRDSPMEFRLRTGMERELPIEKDVERWYPLWGIPF